VAGVIEIFGIFMEIKMNAAELLVTDKREFEGENPLMDLSRLGRA